MNERRVVITGMGCLSPLGNDLGTTWEGLKAGKSGISTITQLDPEPFECKIAGEIKNFNPDGYFGVPKDARRADRYVQFAVAASKMAMEDSGLDVSQIDPRRFGVMVGSGIGGLATLEREHTTYMTKGPKRVSPFTIPMMISNIASGIISMEFGLMGPNMVIVTACATSNHNIGEAWRMIKFGDADGFICGGAEATILPMGLSGFSNMKALSTRNDDPQRASRPFDKNRDGFVMGEGAGVVVLEEYEHAVARGAKIYAEVLGYGLSGDAYHITAPSEDGDGGFRSMQMALKRAGLEPSAVDYINAHGTSTMADTIELGAVERLLGDAAAGATMSSTKSSIGHLLGAAGAVEAIFCILAIRDQIAPPTINLDNPAVTPKLDLAANKAVKRKIDVALSNSFGFGGTNASLVLGRV